MILRPIVDESLVQAPRTRYAISAHLGFRCSRSAMQLGPQRSRWHLAKVGATSHGETSWLKELAASGNLGDLSRVARTGRARAFD